MPAAIVILDGGADRPVPRLGYLTPLEAARKPWMDYAAARGVCGLMYSVAPGVAPSSDVALLAMLGYDVSATPGRGVIEALGAGVPLKNGDLVFRLNIVAVENGVVVDNGYRIGEDEAKELYESAADIVRDECSKRGVDADVVFIGGYKALLIVRGVGGVLRGSRPFRVGVRYEGVKPLVKEAEGVAEAVNSALKAAADALEDHPVNVERAKRGEHKLTWLLPWGAGVYREPPWSFEEKYNVKAIGIGGSTIFAGVCKWAGIEFEKPEGATGSIDSDYRAKALAARKALSSYDLVIVHVEGTDEASHRADPELKKELIERADVIAAELTREGVPFALTCDHATLTSTRDHSGDPVPLAIVGNDGVRDAVDRFGERACMHGSLGVVLGRDLVPLLLNASGSPMKIGL